MAIEPRREINIGEDIKCSCGERGESQSSCDLFNHNMFRNDGHWCTDAELREDGICPDEPPSGIFKGKSAQFAQFYWTDETGINVRGPFHDETEARDSRKRYMRDCL
jgi:hypothetical protein